MGENQKDRRPQTITEQESAASKNQPAGEEMIWTDLDDEGSNSREAARQRRREERRRALRMQRAFFLGVLAVLLIVVIFVVVLCTRHNDPAKTDGSVSDSGKTQETSGTVIADEDTAGEAVSGGDAAQEASDGGEESAAQNSEPVMDTGSEPSRILTQAQLLAAGYDYDGAISLLKGIDSQDPSVIWSVRTGCGRITLP